MGRYDDALAEYIDAVHVEFEAEGVGPVPASIRARRIAATASLHAAMDPWQDCHCVDCLVSRETGHGSV